MAFSIKMWCVGLEGEEGKLVEAVEVGRVYSAGWLEEGSLAFWVR